MAVALWIARGLIKKRLTAPASGALVRTNVAPHASSRTEKRKVQDRVFTPRL
jgi:hypothetical protein